MLHPTKSLLCYASKIEIKGSAAGFKKNFNFVGCNNILLKTAPSVKYELMRFNAPLKNEFIPNLPGKIYREKEYIMLKKGVTKNNDETEESQYGAGSSYSQYVRNEKKQLGTPNISKDSDLSPWIMNLGNGKSLRSYKGNREGNVSENASYYVFMQTADGAFEAYPISAWYTFTPIPKHKTLNDDEAEEEFNRRDKVLNYFSIMVQKRLKTEADPEGEESEGMADKKSQGLQIRDEMDEFELGSGNEYDDDNENNNKNARAKQAPKGKSKKKGRLGKKGGKGKRKEDGDLDEEAAEESDDGDGEGQEMDYMSSGPSSDSEGDDKKKASSQVSKENVNNGEGGDMGRIEMDELLDENELLGVQDELALREEDYDEEADEENGNVTSSRDVPNDNNNIGGGGDKNADDGGGGEKGDGKKSKSKHKHHRLEDSGNNKEMVGDEEPGSGDVRMRSEFSGRSSTSSTSSSTSSSSSSGDDDDDDDDDSSDSDVEIDDNAIQSSIFLQNKAAQPPTSQARTDTSAQGQNKRKLGEPVENSQSKKLLVEPIKAPEVAVGGGMVLSEENVRRYLTRRPMTTKDLLHKFKNKVDTKAQLADRMATILKKINPEKKFIKGKMYLSL